MKFFKTYGARPIKPLFGGYRKKTTASRTRKVILKDGAEVTIRPMTPADVSGLMAMHGRLSRASIYYRYLMAKGPRPSDVGKVCRMARHEGAGVVAEMTGDQGALVGMAYYRITSEDPRKTAEPAILVEDRFQNRGMGAKLLGSLLRLAEIDGITVLESMLHPQNARMRSLLYATGRPLAETPDPDSLMIRLLLDSENEVEFVSAYCERPGSRCGFRFGFGWI